MWWSCHESLVDVSSCVLRETKNLDDPEFSSHAAQMICAACAEKSGFGHGRTLPRGLGATQEGRGGGGEEGEWCDVVRRRIQSSTKLPWSCG